MRYLHRIVMVVLLAGLFAGWTPVQKELWSAYTAVWLVDFGQTRHIAKHPDNHYEEGLFGLYGRHPTTREVDRYFISMYALNLYIANKLSSSGRTLFIGYWVAEHGQCVVSNYSVGIRVDL